jgi:hypothetical protein
MVQKYCTTPRYGRGVAKATSKMTISAISDYSSWPHIFKTLKTLQKRHNGASQPSLPPPGLVLVSGIGFA